MLWAKHEQKNTVKHVVVSVKDVLSFSMRERGMESDLLQWNVHARQKRYTDTAMFPERQDKSHKKSHSENWQWNLLVVGVSMLSWHTIAAKCSDSYPIKVLDNRSYASKCRPVGSRHHILGCISARYVLDTGLFWHRIRCIKRRDAYSWLQAIMSLIWE